MNIIIHCLPNCYPCSKLADALARENVPFSKRAWNPENERDVLEMTRLGIIDLPFPVVEVDGVRLDPAEPRQYYEYILKRCGKW